MVADAPGGEVGKVHRVSDLRQRDVVNINDGKRLGLVSDVEVDPETGRIMALIVPGSGKFFGFFGGASDYVIHWERIVRIGPDVILVDWSTERERGPGNAGGVFGGGFPSGLPGQAGPAGFPPGAAGMPPGFPGAGGLPPNLGQAGLGGAAPPGGPRGPYLIPGPGSMGGMPGGFNPGAAMPGGPPHMGMPHGRAGPMPGGMMPPGPPPEVEPDQEKRHRRPR